MADQTVRDAPSRVAQGAGAAAYAAVASSAVLWGSIGLVVRLVHLSAMAITFYRVLIGGVSILAILLARGQLAQLRPRCRRDILQLALMSAFYTVNWVLYFYAVQLTTVGDAALAYYTAPTFMAIFGALFLNERLDRRTIACVAVSFIGLCVLLDPSGHGRASVDGIFAGAGAGVGYAAAVVTAKPLRRTYTPWSVAAYQTIGATVMLLPFAFVVGGRWSPRSADWIPLLTLGLVHTTFAFWLFFGGIKGIAARRVGFVMYLDPITAVLLSALVLGQPLTIVTVIGGALILGAGGLALRDPSPHLPARLHNHPEEAPPMRITLPRQLTEGRRGLTRVDIHAGTVREILAALDQEHPGLWDRVIDERGGLRRFINIYVNGEDIRFGSGIDTKIATDDELVVLPAMAGGAA